MERYHVFNEIWEYDIMVNGDGLIMACSCCPNNQPHWCVGLNMSDIKSYYTSSTSKNPPINGIEEMLRVKIKKYE